MLLSPQPTISPGSATSSSVTISPTGLATYYTRCTTNGRQNTPVNGIVNKGWNTGSGPFYENAGAAFSDRHQSNLTNYPNSFISPSHDPPAEKYNASQNPMLDTPIASPSHPSQFLRTPEHQPYIPYQDESLATNQTPDLHVLQDTRNEPPQDWTSNHQSTHSYFDSLNDASPSIQRRSAWEYCVNKAQMYPASSSPDPLGTTDQAIYSPSFNGDETPPSYDESRILKTNFADHEVQETLLPKSKKRGVKRKAATAARALIQLIPPLACAYCGRQFNGKYQKSNRTRHINSFHGDLDLVTIEFDDGKKCRSCDQRFKRTDARRKHEWKKHRYEDCRPKKRRIEKRDGERRIYMPPIPDVHDWVIA
ncbi:hypothetical protein N0V90_006640 [Kalmusia sp. IMI 367209]|nr:hypothetical protein N0V90_006640 [Kalmusia sp. IMI 367209]